MKKDTFYLLGAALVGFFVLRGISKAKDVVSTSLNPASEKNLAYLGVNKTIGAVSGIDNFNLGSAIYDGVDWIQGLWGNSDADKRKRLEDQYRAMYYAQDKYK